MMASPAGSCRRPGTAWQRVSSYSRVIRAAVMVMVLCVGSEHTAGSAQHAGWQHRHMAHEVNLNNNGSSSSPLAFHFHRYHPQEGSVIGKAEGYYAKMRLHNHSYAHDTNELTAKPLCRQLDFNSSLAGKIYQDTQSRHYLYELDSCRLRRLDMAQTRACLQGKRLVMLGDSVTRYQYTSLVHFLASGHYQNPYDDGRRSVSNVDHWGHNYDRLYSGVTRKVTDALGSSGMMSCDCDKSKSREEWLFTLFDNSTALDFRYVYRHPTWSAAGIAALNWAMGQAADKIPTPQLPGGAGGGLPSEGGRRLRRHKSKRKEAAVAATPAGAGLAAPTPASRPAPDIVVFNMCAWWGRKNKAGLLGYMREVFQHGRALMDALNGGGGDSGASGGSNSSRGSISNASASMATAAQRQLQLVWKSCTVNNDFWDDAAPVLDDMARQYGWQVLSVRKVVEAAKRQGLMITWNPSTVHFLQLAYETMNDLLFNVICPDASEPVHHK